VSAEQRSQRGSAIENLHDERRTFPPDPAFTAAANAQADLYAEAERDYVAYWERLGRERISWTKPFDTTLEWDLPFAKWFVGGELNVAYNCLDRHVEAGRGDKVAYHWIGEPGDTRTLTYSDLLREVGKAANALKELGVEKGDRVAIYMPMIPELPIAMLACARIGAPHTVVFGGFSAESLADRINDCGAKVLLTADAGYRRGREVGLKGNADEALLSTPSIEGVIVVNRTGHAGDMVLARDHWWHDIVDRQSPECAPVPVDSEHMLYLLYTSGTTAKPKGILHTTAGYLLGASFTHEMIFDLKPDDVYWCAADIGWVTGHTYIVYGPLANGATGVMYEGAPDTPTWDRWWEIIEDYKVSILYMAPTAIRAFMKQGPQYPTARDLTSLRVLGSVGEPINPEAWMWYYEVIGNRQCPVVDTWWQTETGGVLITPLPGATPLKPGSATFPFPGIEPAVLRLDGTEADVNEGGQLVIKKPWPGMMRTVYGNHPRFKETYFTQFPGMYTTGDSARKDEDGYLWIMGRIDDVIKVSGHRLGPAEIESSLVSHPAVAEAAVVGYPHEIKGEAIYAFVTLKEDVAKSKELRTELENHVRTTIGPIAKPEKIQFADALPKTRSGKIMRRILRKIASGEIDQLGDTSTLADPYVVEVLVKERE